MKKVHIQSFFEVLRAANPEPTSELEYVNVYTLLVAVVLSAQATDVGVNKATRELFKKVETPEAIMPAKPVERTHQDHRAFQLQGQEHRQALGNVDKGA